MRFPPGSIVQSTTESRTTIKILENASARYNDSPGLLTESSEQVFRDFRVGIVHRHGTRPAEGADGECHTASGRTVHYDLLSITILDSEAKSKRI